MSLGVNMLTNGAKISDATKTDFLGLIFFQRDQNIWQKHCHADLSSVSNTLTCWLTISVPTRGFLGIYVTVPFPVYNFRNKQPPMVTFFSKKSKFNVDFENAAENW